MKIGPNYSFILFLTISIFTADRFLKYLSLFPPLNNEGVNLLGHWFRLKLALNPGLAFGLPCPAFLIVPFYLIVVLVLFWFLIPAISRGERWLTLAFFLIFAGAFSNLLDRWRLDQVIDYFNFKWTVFNLADLMIIGGLLIILLKKIK